MMLLFQAVFTWCDPLIGGIESAMAALAVWVSEWMPRGILNELFVEGIIAGIGNILVFLPQIILLFLGIAILEDTGYMARAALLVDRMMRGVGLHGKAFVPLLSSFACAIPGVMAARTISNRRDRLVTILIAPLMSCSARLPVFTLVIGAVFATAAPVWGVFSLGGLLITAMYFLGLFAALAMARLFKSTLLKAPTPPFLMELPSYKLPSIKTVGVEVYRRGRIFVVQTGTIILALSVILWALMAYPRYEFTAEQKAQQMSQLTQKLSVEEARSEVSKREASQRLHDSIAGHMGRFIEPAIAPLGFDWKIGIGLIGSFAAREVLVSTLGQVYGVGSNIDEESVVLRKAILSDIHPDTGKPRFTPLTGLSLMVFFVLAMQCMSTVAVVRRETASWHWPLFMIAYMNGLAWLGAFATYRIGLMLGMA
jgi:ferrous iron transport protein B